MTQLAELESNLKFVKDLKASFLSICAERQKVTHQVHSMDREEYVILNEIELLIIGRESQLRRFEILGK